MSCTLLHPPVLFACTALVWLLAAVVGNPAAAAEAAPEAEAPLRVAVKPAPPFVVQDADGNWSGLAIDLFEEVARTAGHEFVYQETGLKELFDDVATGAYDVGVGAITVTLERERRIDFSHPFYTTGFGIATPASESAWWNVLAQAFSLNFLKAVCGLLVLLGAVGVVVWLAERRRNTEQFGGTPIEGLGNGLWWSAVTMTTVGYGDKAPVTFAGRIVGLGWMFASIIIISSFTAAIASSLTVGGLSSQIEGLADLHKVEAGVVEHTTAEQFCIDEGIPRRSFADLAAALAALREGTVQAVVHDRPLLVHATHGDEVLRVLPNEIGRQDYALVLPTDSPQREAINRHILDIIESGQWQRLKNRYLQD